MGLGSRWGVLTGGGGWSYHSNCNSVQWARVLLDSPFIWISQGFRKVCTTRNINININIDTGETPCRSSLFVSAYNWDRQYVFLEIRARAEWTCKHVPSRRACDRAGLTLSAPVEIVRKPKISTKFPNSKTGHDL